MVSLFNIVVYISLSFILGFCATTFRLSSWMLKGLQYYVCPENSMEQGTQNVDGSKSTRETEAQSNTNTSGSRVVDKQHWKNEISARKRDSKRKNRDKFVWEEGNSKILRLILSHLHVQGHLYYKEYNEAVVYSLVGLGSLLACVVLSCFARLNWGGFIAEDSGFLKNDELIPFVMGLFALFKVVRALIQVGWQGGMSKNLELALSLLVGCIGFIVAAFLLQFTPAKGLGLNFDQMYMNAVGLSPIGVEAEFRQQLESSILSSVLVKMLVAVIAAGFTGILVVPAHRSVRSFWLGTDQLQWGMPVIRIGPVMRWLLHLNIILPIFASVVWIKPLGQFFVASKGLIKAITMPEEVFQKVQIWSLLLVGLLQLGLFRVNMQVYLNEGLVMWYQSLHHGKSMNLELTRAKLLLNNYFLCRVAVQFVTPAMVIILLLGMSRVLGGWNSGKLLERSASLLLLRGVALFLAWWANISWMVLTCSILALYRIGFFLAI